MTRRKWQDASGNPRSYSRNRWFAKLAEEFGEVGLAMANHFDVRGKSPAAEAQHDSIDRNLLMELEHVEYIAGLFRKQVAAEIKAKRKAAKKAAKGKGQAMSIIDRIATAHAAQVAREGRTEGLQLILPAEHEPVWSSDFERDVEFFRTTRAGGYRPTVHSNCDPGDEHTDR